MRATAEGYLLFCTEVGKPLDRRNVMRRFTQIPRAWSSPGAPLRTLRHSTASFLIAAGVHMKVAQEVLGHSSYAITADFYSHVAPAQQRDAAQKPGASITW